MMMTTSDYGGTMVLTMMMMMMMTTIHETIHDVSNTADDAHDRVCGVASGNGLLSTWDMRWSSGWNVWWTRPQR